MQVVVARPRSTTLQMPTNTAAPAAAAAAAAAVPVLGDEKGFQGGGEAGRRSPPFWLIKLLENQNFQDDIVPGISCLNVPRMTLNPEHPELGSQHDIGPGIS